METEGTGATDGAVLATLATWLRLGSSCESLPAETQDALSELADALDPEPPAPA